jgi:Na+/H+-dicarboxylate symporter
MLAGNVGGALVGGLWPSGGRALHSWGELFIGALLALVVPRVMTSVIVGLARLGDARRLRGLGPWTWSYFVVTTGSAVLMGLLLVTATRSAGATDRGGAGGAAVGRGRSTGDCPPRLRGSRTAS